MNIAPNTIRRTYSITRHNSQGIHYQPHTVQKSPDGDTLELRWVEFAKAVRRAAPVTTHRRKRFQGIDRTTIHAGVVCFVIAVAALGVCFWYWRVR